MAEKNIKVRLFLDASMGAAQSLELGRDQAHYLFSVMRLQPGDRINVFNGRDGEWAARIDQAGKRGGRLSLLEQRRAQQTPPDLWLCFAPIKKTRTDFIVEKAAELGAARILPISTRLTNSARIRRDRLQAHAVEAAEQCGGTYVPEVVDLQPLDHLLGNWPEDRRIMYCDETLVGARAALQSAQRCEKWAILTGPEGGFSPDERAQLRALPQVTPVSLGPRILRADTAAVAALTLWQSLLGDWR
ncbi:MAG: 16S rRNA (uracil(1498)-N(3))-methyltransferase [Paracoccaceae bacterium]